MTFLLFNRHFFLFASLDFNIGRNTVNTKKIP